MIQILEQTVNARGQVILRTNRKGFDEIVALPYGMTPAHWLAKAREGELRTAGQAAIAEQDAQIEREVLRAGRGVIAVQDTRTGKASAYLEPARLDGTPESAPLVRRDGGAGPLDRTTSPGTGTDKAPLGVRASTSGIASLSPARRSQLTQQRDALKLLVDDRMSSAGARRAAAAEIADIEKLLALPDTKAMNSATDRFVEPEPYFVRVANAAKARDDEGGAAQPSTEEQVAALKAEIASLVKILADGSTDLGTRTHAQARLDQVRGQLQDIGRQLPVSA